MNCTCIDLPGKCSYDIGIIYRKKNTGLLVEKKVYVGMLAQEVGQCLCRLCQDSDRKLKIGY